MPTYRFTAEEIEALRDALRKGSARHASYAKFYKHRDTADMHRDLATRQLALLGRFENEPTSAAA